MKTKQESNTHERLYSPGFYDRPNHVVLEQVKGSKYAVSLNLYLPEDKQLLMKKGEGYGLVTDYSCGEQDFFPLERCPWPLVEKPRNYGNYSSLWRNVRQYIWEHFYVPKEETYDVLTAWVFASYVPETWRVVPYLFFHGPIASGKTRGMEVLHTLCYRGLLCSNISSAALFRAVSEWHPVVFLDESEIYNAENKSDIIGLLNSGYRRGQVAIRVRHTEHGEELECFDVFGFKVLAGTEGFRSTLESRCIMIRTVKNRRKVRFYTDEKQAEEIRSELLQWRFNFLETYTESSAEGSEPSESSLEGIGEARVQELFQSLITVSNDGRENIIKFAKNTAKERLEEAKTSIDTSIIEISQGLTDSDIIVNPEKEQIFLTKTVQNKLNQDKEEQDKLKAQVVGRIIKRLGFSARHTEHGNGWLYDKERLEMLKAIYLTSSEQPSEPSKPSKPSAKLEVCKFCGKPITDAVHDFVSEEDKDFSAHIDCAMQWRQLRGIAQ
jgi:hypothetical protein